MADIEHINVKIFAVPSSTVHWPDLIPILHRWIQEKTFDDIVPVDVADYAHVPAGPGVMLIGHHANISLDNRQQRLGMLYNRKTVIAGSIKEKLAQAYESALGAARQLENEPELHGGIRFDEGSFEVFINDRLLAPNTPETGAKLVPEIESHFTNSLGGPVSLEWNRNARELFRVEVRASALTTTGSA